jgi:hypothetical protein
LVAATTRTSTSRGRGRPQRRDLAALEGAQQPALELERQLAELVEEQRAAMSGLEGALAGAVGAGEGPALVAEQRALDQGRRLRGAVDHDERAAAPRAGVVERAGGQLLAGARLAGDEDGELGRREAGQQAEHPAHRDAGAAQLAEPHRVGDRQLDRGGERPQSDRRPAQAERGLAGDRGVVEPNLADVGPVGRVEVAQAPAGGHHLDRQVLARHRGVGQAQRAAGMGADHGDVVVEVVGPLLVGPGHDLEAQAAAAQPDHALALDHRQGVGRPGAAHHRVTSRTPSAGTSIVRVVRRPICGLLSSRRWRPAGRLRSRGVSPRATPSIATWA